MRPTTSSCVLLATATNTNRSQLPAFLPRFAAWVPRAHPWGNDPSPEVNSPCSRGSGSGQPKAHHTPLSSSLTSLTTRALCCLPSSWLCGVSCCRSPRAVGWWPELQVTFSCHDTSTFHCSHCVSGDLEAAASPSCPALGPVWVGRGPGEVELLARVVSSQCPVSEGHLPISEGILPHVQGDMSVCQNHMSPCLRHESRV